MRIACLLVPDLPLRAELRSHPELEGKPIAVATGPDARADVISASEQAWRAGVRPPCSVTRARAVCPELQVRAASPAAERAARAALLDVAFSCSPRAAPAARASGIFAGEAAVFVDARGVDSLFSGPGFAGEPGFASALSQRAERVGLPGLVTLASSRATALLVARSLCTRPDALEREHVQVLPPGQERRFLEPLSLDLLDPDDDLAATLTRFGVRCVRDLLRLPRRGLAGRLGPRVLALMARARGEEPALPLPEPRDGSCQEELDLEYPVDQLEALRFVLRGALSRLIGRLALRGLGCGALDLDLHLEGGGRDVRRVGVSAPTHDVRVLLRLLSLSLESRPPDAAVLRVSIATRGLPLRRDQLDLFRPRTPDPVALDQTLAELESLCGEGRVGAPSLPDDHRPDAFSIVPFAPQSGDPAARGDREERRENEQETTLAVRALRPPVPAQVHLAAGLPVSLRSAVASGSVVHVAGPWRTTGHWWSETERFAFDYYDVQVSDGSVLRLCFDWIRRAWRVDAVYD